MPNQDLSMQEFYEDMRYDDYVEHNHECGMRGKDDEYFITMSCFGVALEHLTKLKAECKQYDRDFDDIIKRLLIELA